MTSEVQPQVEILGTGSHESWRARYRLNWWLPPLAIAVFSTVALYLVERTMRLVSPEILREGYRFQDWTSNWMMQTLGLEDMHPFGPQSLWYDHIYPPLEDTIRYVFSFPETSAGLAPDGLQVDFRLYVLYAVCFGIVNALIFIWVRNLTRNSWWAFATTSIWAISPGFVMTMTLLDPSPLSMVSISLTFFLLFYFLKYRYLGFATAFFAALLLASTARSVTQPHVLLVIVVALITFWFIAKKRNRILFAINIALVALMFVIPIKQFVLYDTLDTTSFAGYHRAGMLWIDPRTVPGVETPQYIVDNALKFSSRYNTQETIKDNYRLTKAANEFIVHHPIEALQRLGKSLGVTVPELLRPSSMYTQNYMVERMPWRTAFDWLFSGWRYLTILIGSAAIIVFTRGKKGTWALVKKYGWFAGFYLLIAAPIFLSNRYTPGQEDLGPLWTDAIRQKVFLEVPLAALVSYALWLVLTKRGRSSW